ncbi:MAG: hypothetical protein LBL16_05020 [Endomicrobium sp.]|jgi:hypothetical protein|nr:hypothetical protein [Endomicrobium sp.]
MKNKNYTHNSREMMSVEFIRAEQLKKTKPTPDFYEFDKEKNIVEIKEHIPNRKYEFNRAGYFYLQDAAKYLCTHHKDALFLNDSIYIKAEVKPTTFTDITIGEFKYQKEKLKTELAETSDHRCYIPNGKGGYYLMHPFMVIPESASNEELTEEERKRFSNINALKIKKFHFYFAKPMFEKYLNSGQYFQHPKNLYAKVWDTIMKLDIGNNSDARLVEGIDYQRRINYKELLSETRFVAGYIRFIDYLYLHGAGNPDVKSISIDDAKLVKMCCPSLTQTHKDGRILLRDKAKADAFIRMIVVLTNRFSSDGLDYQVKGVPKTNPDKPRTLIFEFDHPQRVKEIHQNKLKASGQAGEKEF